MAVLCRLTADRSCCPAEEEAEADFGEADGMPAEMSSSSWLSCETISGSLPPLLSEAGRRRMTLASSSRSRLRMKSELVRQL